MTVQAELLKYRHSTEYMKCKENHCLQ